jgi:hypothetical protein
VIILNQRADFGVALSTVLLLVIAGAIAGFPYRAAGKPIVALTETNNYV